MKKAALLSLITLLILLLAACQQTSTIDNQTLNIDPQSDPLAFLQAASKKLQSATSFEIYSTDVLAAPKTEDFTVDDKYKSTVMIQYTANKDGYPMIFIRPQTNKELNENDYFIYLHEDSGFAHLWGGIASVQSDTSLSSSQIPSILRRFTGNDGSSLIADFAALNPSVSLSDDGSIIFLAKNLTFEQLNNLSGQIMENYVLADERSSYSVKLTVNANGFLSSMKFLVEDPVRVIIENHPGLFQKDCFSFVEYTFAHINEEIEITQANLLNNLLANPEGTSNVLHAFGDSYQALYQYNSKEDCYDLSIFFIDWSDSNDQVIPFYKAETEINGKSVRHITCQSGVALGCRIARLVVPKGVTFNNSLNGDVRNQIILFFEDSKSDVTKGFTLPEDCVNENDEYSVTAAYYAGEWEYVDGIPHPLK